VALSRDDPPAGRHGRGGDKVTLGGPDIGVKTLATFRRFVTEGGMPLIDWDQSRQQFIAGKTGIFFDTPARLRQVTDLIGDKFTLRTAIFPIDDKAKADCHRRQRGHHHREGPQKQKAAWEFLKFATGPRHRRSSSKEPATCPPTCARPARVPRTVLRQEPELPTVAQQVDAPRRGRAIRRGTRCASGARSARSSRR
jgi:hypothetical protein